ncbi:MAG: prepilin-type N-terminal cleavage/methylation domain-containing protein, partial [Victivallales bacterium]|nr:prepilin-type N-terminal cleavage/methylation domain-containing protein [Victivallales bacterium]
MPAHRTMKVDIYLNHNIQGDAMRGRHFTLIELLVVIAIIA